MGIVQSADTAMEEGTVRDESVRDEIVHDDEKKTDGTSVERVSSKE